MSHPQNNVSPEVYHLLESNHRMTFYEKYLKGVKWGELAAGESIVLSAVSNLLVYYKAPPNAIMILCAIVAVSLGLFYLRFPKETQQIIDVIGKGGASGSTASWAVVPVSPVSTASTPTALPETAGEVSGAIVQPEVVPLPAVEPAPPAPPADLDSTSTPCSTSASPANISPSPDIIRNTLKAL